MRLWGITIRPILFAAVIIPAIIIGAVVFRPFVLRTIDKWNLTPAADLVGVWAGAGKFKDFDQNNQGFCHATYSFTLTVRSQQGNTIDGFLNFTQTAGSDARCAAFIGYQEGPVALDPNNTLNGSRITINGGTLGIFHGTFTSELITVNEQEQGTWIQLLDGAFTLTRQ